jgi:hypothetical protein
MIDVFNFNDFDSTQRLVHTFCVSVKGDDDDDAIQFATASTSLLLPTAFKSQGSVRVCNTPERNA